MMTTIKQWLRITPLDTMFFKGSEPMIAGVNHEVRTVFPPLPTTLVGAIRSAVLGQRKIDPYQYTGGGHAEICQQFPLLGPPEKPGFELAGPLFEVTTTKGRELLFPAPAHWHHDPEAIEGSETMQVSVTEPAGDLLADVGLCGSTKNPLWLLNPPTPKTESLSGWWTNAAALVAMRQGKADLAVPEKAADLIPGAPAILPLGALFVTEARSGIALDLPTRRVREGYLYTATHVRLQPEVALLAGFSETLCPNTLDAKGIMQLGGEQRVARYESLGENAALPESGSGQWALAVSAIPWAIFATTALAALPRASGPLVRMGGWDMKKQFHKDMTAWLPPGTSIYLEDKNPLPFGFIHI